VLSTSVNITLADIESNARNSITHPQHEIASYTMTTKIQKVLTLPSDRQGIQGAERARHDHRPEHQQQRLAATG